MAPRPLCLLCPLCLIGGLAVACESDPSGSMGSSEGSSGAPATDGSSPTSTGTTDGATAGSTTDGATTGTTDGTTVGTTTVTTDGTAGGTTGATGGATSGPGVSGCEEATADTVKVYVLAGQSNAQGQGLVPLEDEDFSQWPLRHTLEGLVNRGEEPQALLEPRDDVEVQVVDNPLEPLQPGQGARSNRIGAELGFGHVMGDLLTQPIIILKCVAGGSSLAEEWRPPSAVANRGGVVGDLYTACIDRTNALMAADSNRELVAFMWLQGWNDQIDDERRAEYEANLIDFGRDVRTSFGSELPFLIIQNPDINGQLTAAREAAVVALNGDVPDAAFFSENNTYLSDNGFFEGHFHFHDSAANYLYLGRNAAADAAEQGFCGQ